MLFINNFFFLPLIIWKVFKYFINFFFKWEKIRTFNVKLKIWDDDEVEEIKDDKIKANI